MAQDHNQDEYQTTSFYKKNAANKDKGFVAFTKEGTHYFTYFIDGDVALLSQAYKAVAGRDNGIASVTKNMKLEDRYRFFKDNAGKHRFSIVAGNGQEVAISPYFTSEATARRFSATLIGGQSAGAIKVKKTVPKKGVLEKNTTKKSVKPKSQISSPRNTGKKSTNRIENYHPLAFYEKRINGVQDGFDPFSDGDAHYFTYNQSGKIILISESYTAKVGRDNGIESVKKNMSIKARYQHHIHKNGKHYFDLNAGNHQEIATSIWYNSAAAATAGAAKLRGEAPKKRRTRTEDNYKPLTFYQQQTKKKESGFSTFKAKDGQHYFAVYSNGKIELISEGYPTKAAMETGRESVRKNMKLENRYEYRTLKNGKFDYRLKAGNGKEIARSVWYGSAASAAAGAAYLLGKRKKPTTPPISKIAKVAPVAATAAIVAGTTAVAKPVKSADKADDYLPCDAYRGHKINDTINNVAFFKHNNGQFYFVLYGDDGDVRLRSEGFPTAKARDIELSGVLRLKDNPEYYKKIEKGAHYIDVLYDETGREVGRSCLRKEKAAVAAPPPVVAAAPIAAATSSVTPAGSNGLNWGWLKWLLLLLLLLLFTFGLKSCMDRGALKKAEAAAAAKVETARIAAAKKTAAIKAETERKTKQAAAAAAAIAAEAEAKATEQTSSSEPEAAPVATPNTEPVTIETAEPTRATIGYIDRVCTESETFIFNVPSYVTPISVVRLGTYPQFGDSHGLSPSGFYDKLRQRYENNSFDAAYLNYLARSIGYQGGFSEIQASDFSEDTLPQGAKGLLGFGDFHGVAVSQLNVRSKNDLEAFRIRGANGTDIHFMKSCGNYMYMCQ